MSRTIQECILLRSRLCLKCLNSRHLIIQWQDIWKWAYGRDRERIDLCVTLGVMVLDVQEVCRVLEGCIIPVQIPHPLVDCRISGTNIADVALEVLDVDRIETDNGDKSVRITSVNMHLSVLHAGVQAGQNSRLTF